MSRLKGWKTLSVSIPALVTSLSVLGVEKLYPNTFSPAELQTAMTTLVSAGVMLVLRLLTDGPVAPVAKRKAAKPSCNPDGDSV